MKIKSVIIGCDSNPDYLDFWPVVAQQWATQIGIHPILCYVGEGMPPASQYGEVITYPVIKGIPTPFQGQWVRFFHAAHCKDDVVTMADIDLLPLPHPLYKEWLQDFDDNKYIHTSARFCERGRFAACYHIAKGSTFRQVWNMPDDWEEAVRQVIGHPLAEFDGNRYNFGIDELYTTQKILAYPQQDIFFHLLDFDPKHNGYISRRLWYYDVKLLDQRCYVLVNLIRPYHKYYALTEAIAKGLVIPAPFRYLFRLVSILRNIRKRGVRNNILRLRTRLFYRIVYKIYLLGLNYYFRQKIKRT